MINYIDKGIYLTQAVEAAGERLWQEVGTGGWFSTNDALVQSIVDNYDPLLDAKLEKVAAIDAYAAKLRNKVTAGTSPAEMAKWEDKYKQALAYQAASQDSSAPDLAAEANVRGITTAALVAKVITNGQQLTALEATIAGNAGKHRDVVNVLTDWRLVEAYDFSSGWPQV